MRSGTRPRDRASASRRRRARAAASSPSSTAGPAYRWSCASRCSSGSSAAASPRRAPTGAWDLRSASSRSRLTVAGSGSTTRIPVPCSASSSPMIKNTDLPFRQLVDAAPDGMIVCDPKGTMVLVNGEAERMFGYGRNELLGHSIDMLVPDRIRSHHGKHVEGFAAKPKLRPMGSGLELAGRRKDGSEFPVEISLSPVPTPTGLFITAGIRDVSERRRLEGEAKKANAYLVSAVDSVQDAFALFDENDRVLIVNSAARQLLGGSEGSAVVGRKFEELLRDALASGAFDFSNETRDSLLERWLAYHRAPSGTLEVRTGTGRYLRVSERKTAEHGTVATIADVTDDVQHADELEQAR